MVGKVGARLFSVACMKVVLYFSVVFIFASLVVWCFFFVSGCKRGVFSAGWMTFCNFWWFGS